MTGIELILGAFIVSVSLIGGSGFFTAKYL